MSNDNRLGKQTRWILGVDGGGTKTVAAIARFCPDQGKQSSVEVIGTGRGGPGNPRSVGFDHAFENVETAIRDAIRASQHELQNSRIDAACVALAGVARPDERANLSSWLETKSFANQTILTEDIDPIRFAPRIDPGQQANSSEWANCVTLIAGTGSIAKLYLANGQSFRAGGWGYLLGDQGSGFHIGLSAIQRLCLDFDAGQPLSEMQEQILFQLGLKAPPDLIAFAYSGGIPRPAIAALAPTVLKWAGQEPAAKYIANQAIDGWFEMIRKLTRFFPSDPFTYGLSVGGGVATTQSWMLDELLKRLHDVGCSPAHTFLVLEPVMGCLQCAREAIRC